MPGIKVQDLAVKTLPDNADRLLIHDPAEPGAVKEKTVSVASVSAKAAADRLAGLAPATAIADADNVGLIVAGAEKKITWANHKAQAAADRLAGFVAATGLLPADFIEIINAGAEKKITWADFLVQLAADFAAPPAPNPKNEYQFGFAGLADGYNLEIALVVKPAASGYGITRWPAGFAALVEYSINAGLAWSSVLPALVSESIVYARISFAAGFSSGIVKLVEN